MCVCVFVSALHQLCVLCFQRSDISSEEDSTFSDHPPILHDEIVDQHHRQMVLHCYYEASCVLWYNPMNITEICSL